MYVQDPIVMKKDDNFVEVFSKFRVSRNSIFPGREAQCILGECEPLSSLIV